MFSGYVYNMSVYYIQFIQLSATCPQGLYTSDKFQSLDHVSYVR